MNGSWTGMKEMSKLRRLVLRHVGMFGVVFETK